MDTYLYSMCALDTSVCWSDMYFCCDIKLVCTDVTSVNEALNVLLCRKHDLIVLPNTNSNIKPQ